jgi:hypothetical protein
MAKEKKEIKQEIEKAYRPMTYLTDPTTSRKADTGGDTSQ